MRIGVNCHLLGPDIGGIRQYFFNVFNELLVKDTANQYVFFYFEHNVSELEKLQSDRWKEYSIKLQFTKEIYGHLDEIDLFFCPFSTLCPRPLPLPTVYTIPDIQEVYYPQFFSSYLRVARTYHYVGSSKMADRIITHSNFSKDTLVTHHKVPKDKVVVAYHSVDNRYYRAQEVGISPDYTLPDQFVFFPANKWVHKNHDLLLRAVLWLREEKNVLVDVVTTGFEKEDGYPLTEKINEYGLEQQVHQLGYVTVEEMAFLYAHADMLVFPSLFEGFGIPIVEAMASGCPVIAAEATSLPEVADDAAIYFNPSSYEDLGKKIAELRNNEVMKKDLISRGGKRVEMFSSERSAHQHLIAFAEANNSFSMTRYYWLRYCYKYLHMMKFLVKRDSYMMLGDIFARKMRKLGVLIFQR